MHPGPKEFTYRFIGFEKRQQVLDDKEIPLVEIAGWHMANHFSLHCIVENRICPAERLESTGITNYQDISKNVFTEPMELCW